MRLFRLVTPTLLVVALSASACPSAFADPVDDIVRSLTPQKTRSLSSPSRPQDNDDEAFIDTLRNSKTRSLSSNDRSRVDAVVADKPSVDLVMEFPYNSDVIRGPALDTANALGKALSSSDLKDRTFVIAGHTDAKGSDEANQKLSDRRAQAVKRFLVSHYSIKPTNLITVGYGKSHLKDPADPFGAENRRVQTVNVLPNKSVSSN